MFRRVAKVGVGFTLLGGAGMGYVYQQRLKQNQSVSAEQFNAAQDPKRLKECIDACVNHKPGAEPLVLYRYTTCPFCGKVKAFLDYHNIKHECVEVEPIFKTEIQPNGYYKVPQLRFEASKGGPFLVDSDVIVDRMSEHIKDKNWKNQMKDASVKRWREYAREKLVRYIVINVNSSLYEAWKGYEYIDQHDTIPPLNKLFLKVLGAPVMYMVSRFKTLPALEKADGYDPKVVDPGTALRGVLQEWTKEGLGNGKTKYNGGVQPNVADVEVYGVLQSIRGHRVYNDIVRGDPIVRKWLDDMDSSVKKDGGQSGKKG